MSDHNPKFRERSISTTYADAGVNIDAGKEMVEKIKPFIHSTKRAGSNTEIGGFGGLFDLKEAGYKDPILVAANDGVGTKLKIAIQADDHGSIGIDLVAMCVNDLIVQGAEPLFFLDYYATGKLDPDHGTRIVAGIAEGCRQAGCAIIGGETAEMPGMYANNDYDLAGFAVGAVERGALLPSPNMKKGDVVLGLMSSGLHSNGFSLVRQIIETSKLNLNDPAPFAANKSLAQALLIPTRIYVRSVLAAIRAGYTVKGLAHITGGGFSENIPRILPANLAASINLSAIDIPSIFSWIAKQGKITAKEMLRTFNCGIGMILIVDPKDVFNVDTILVSEGETVVYLGELKYRVESCVTYQGALNL